MIKQNQLDAIVFQDNHPNHLTGLDFSDLKNFHDQLTPMMVMMKPNHHLKSVKGFLESIKVHPIVMNDIFNQNQRAKIEIIDDVVFCVLSYMDESEDKIQLKTNKITLLIHKNYILVFVPDTFNFNLESIMKHFEGISSLPKLDSCLFYFLQEMLNQVFETMQEDIDQLEHIEDLLIGNSKKINLKDLYFLRRNFFIIRKVLLPLLDALDLFSKFKPIFSQDDSLIYFSNMYKQVNRTIQSLDFYQHMVSNIHDIYMSNINNLMNRSVAVITKFATIFIPITFITGIFGMNFENRLFNNPYGFTVTIAGMALLAGVMTIYMKSKKFDLDIN